MRKEAYHWADSIADTIIKERGNKKQYICASGISPSGHIHIGNFRELITVDFVSKALQNQGKKTIHIHSWDNFDRFRKVPAGFPDSLNKYVGVNYSDIPDPFKCHKTYAEHFEKELENSIKPLGLDIKFINQAKKWKACEYAEEMKKALTNTEIIIKVLNKYRKEPLEEPWYPTVVYCEKCKKDSTKVIDYDMDYNLTYECKCGFKDTFDFRKKGIAKLFWRVDWPMRQNYENVDFEPGGKDHSTPGGSRDTGKEIIRAIWNRSQPIYQMYDFVIGKGSGGKMSGSLGNIITPEDVLEIYEPEIVRYLFASTVPNKEFFISFDLDVIKTYEDFDQCERIYFGKEEIRNKALLPKMKRIYELSCIEIPKKFSEQPSFRHLVTLVQLYKGDTKEVLKHFKKDKDKVKKRAELAWNWVQKYAPEEMKFTVQEDIKEKLDSKQTKALKSLAEVISKKTTEEKLKKDIFEICQKLEIEPREFFKISYKVILNKERGPKLVTLILLDQKNILKLLKKVK